MRNPGNRRLPESFQSDIHFFNGSQSSALYKGLIVEPDMVTHSETTLIPCKEGTVVGAQKPFVWEPSPQCRRSVCYRCALDPTSKEVLHCSDCEWAYGGGKKCQVSGEFWFLSFEISLKFAPHRQARLILPFDRLTVRSIDWLSLLSFGCHWAILTVVDDLFVDSAVESVYISSGSTGNSDLAYARDWQSPFATHAVYRWAVLPWHVQEKDHQHAWRMFRLTTLQHKRGLFLLQLLCTHGNRWSVWRSFSKNNFLDCFIFPIILWLRWIVIRFIFQLLFDVLGLCSTISSIRSSMFFPLPRSFLLISI